MKSVMILAMMGCVAFGADVLVPLDAVGTSKTIPCELSRAGKWQDGFSLDGTDVVCETTADRTRSGAGWSVRLDQESAVPVKVCADVKVEKGTGAGEVLLYVDVGYVDGGHLWGQKGRVLAVPGDWSRTTVTIVPESPIRGLACYVMARDAENVKARFHAPVVTCLQNAGGCVTFDSLPVDVKASPNGFLVRDVKKGTGFASVANGGAAHGVRLDCRQTKRDGAEFYDATFTDAEGGDRAVTCAWALPLASDDVVWFDTPRSERSLRGKRGDYRKITGSRCGVGGFSSWPFIAASVGGKGVAIGVDPYLPGYFRLSLHADLKTAYIAYDFGLAPEKNAARVGFVTFPFDAKDGFRGALEAYQKLYPELNEVKQTKQGNWMAFAPISKIENWEDFGIAIKEGDGEVKWDDEHGVTTYRYTEPTTWWMSIKGRDGRKTATYAECLAQAEEMAKKAKDGTVTGWNAYAAAWKQCAMKDELGNCCGRILDTPWCNGIVWNLNCAPGQGPNGEFAVKYPDSHFEKNYRGSFPEGLDGEYVDSAEMYVTAEIDYNRANFAGMATPLVFAQDTFKVGVFRGMMGFEYVHGMWKKVRAKGRRAMANGAPSRWCWQIPFLDVTGTETNWRNDKDGWRPDSDDSLIYRRALCGGKPYCFLMNTDFNKFTYEMCEKYMQRALAYGMYPSFFSPQASSSSHYFKTPKYYERDRPLFRKYMPIVIKVGEAGWRPVNRRFPVDPKTGVFAEQFGENLVTLFNPSKTESRTLTVPQTKELVTGAQVGGELTLPPETCRVLEFGAFRPPAVPLAVNDPYFSVWSPSDALTGAETMHWSRDAQPLSVVGEVRGKTWRFCGVEPKDVPAAKQVSVEVHCCETVYAFDADGTRVELRFSTPFIPGDWDVFSRPVTYLTVKGAKAKVAISPAFATDDDAAAMVTNRTTVSGCAAVSVGRRDQTLLQTGDRVRANGGYAWLVEAGDHFLLAYDAVKDGTFLSQEVKAWWRRDGKAFEAMLAEALRDYPRLMCEMAAFDRAQADRFARIGGEKYARIAELAWRQSYGAGRLLASPRGEMLYFSKENTSNGCVATIDILYPQLPHLMLGGAALAKASMLPDFLYAASAGWTYDYAPHDLGSFPCANAQHYGMGKRKDGTPRPDADRMPVEESGNLILCLYALVQAEGKTDFAVRFWPMVEKWAAYLERTGFDPENQLCTDDFAGHLAHNANLSVKSILAFEAFARLADRLGKADLAAKYHALAKDGVGKWLVASGSSNGVARLAFDAKDTWSSKYNLAFGKAIGLDIFPADVFRREVAGYRANCDRYGTPLDSRRHWAKADWLVWIATLAETRADFEALVSPLHAFLDESTDRVPFADLYYTQTGKVVRFGKGDREFIGMNSRPVVGGVFLPVFAADARRIK